MKAKCTVCGQPFEQARTDQQFCSPACKQKSYRKKKVEPVDQGSMTKITFRISDYTVFLKEYNFDRLTFPFTLFCFYRRFLPGSLTGDALHNAIADIVPDSDEWSRIMKRKPYVDFEEKFLSNEFEIID